ncbi:MAG: hypothetical protein ACYSW6_06380 [Planctomycetota bacterium]
MKKSVVLFVLVASFFCNSKAATKKVRPLRGGFMLEGVDGKLRLADGGGRWYFDFDSDVSDERGVVKAGTGAELLRSAALEKMLSDAKGRPEAGYRIWGSITEYKGENFIFLIYFLPTSEVKEAEETRVEESGEQRPAKVTINEPNDELAVPEEIIARLRARKVVRTEPLKKGLELKSDFIMADRTGYISLPARGDGGRRQDEKETEKESTQYEFVPDGLGRKMERLSFPLLPCQALELAGQKQSASLEQVRFKISGIVTTFEGQHYLLLQRASRVYSHGNFGR